MKRRGARKSNRPRPPIIRVLETIPTSGRTLGVGVGLVVLPPPMPDDDELEEDEEDEEELEEEPPDDELELELLLDDDEDELDELDDDEDEEEPPLIVRARGFIRMIMLVEPSPMPATAVSVVKEKLAVPPLLRVVKAIVARVPVPLVPCWSAGTSGLGAVII